MLIALAFCAEIISFFSDYFIAISNLNAAKDLSTNQSVSALVEYLLGMKLSTLSQTGGMCISALHQSSGYSFSLTWAENAAGKESELLYRVASLRTFKRVAPEWIRKVLVFSTSMYPIFFERIANVIKLHQ
ncbi:uncharacterized protein LOC123209622 [Mangifera indica]|uniref:uncharacterized protein LOC123209622 n=1 Tax=Mangifera indica TaxID=29780 RepID=UPI001CFBC486|nr:uncharacterized protein LOC123209622 [Mangifera indica]